MSTFSIPYPPTTNNLFLNVGKRRVRTKGYDNWTAAGAALIALQKPERVSGPFRLTLVANRPDRRRRDLDNIIKPTADLLTKAGVIADDSNAVEITARWADEIIAGGALTVTVEAA